jgi:putative ABC transport system substrate-binding protein
MRHRLCAISLILALFVMVLADRAGAQQPGKMVRLGWLSPSGGPGEEFLQAMHEQGYSEGQNLVIEVRVTEGHVDRYPALAAELLALKPDCIVAVGVGAVLAAKQATATIPIVMANADADPVRVGLVASFARPGGNVTGVTSISSDLAGKRLGLLRDLIPGLVRVAILWRPDAPASTAHVEETEAAAGTIGLSIKQLVLRPEGELAGVFQEVAANEAQAVIVPSVALRAGDQRTIVDLAIAGRVPLMATSGAFAEAGALISYHADFRESFRRVADYVSRTLKGAKPADLPVLRPTKFELVVNLKTAAALRISIPQSILAHADRVIE